MNVNTSSSQNEAQAALQLPMPEHSCGDVEQWWYSAAVTQPDNGELWSPDTHANKELTFKPNYVNIDVSYQSCPRETRLTSQYVNN